MVHNPATESSPLLRSTSHLSSSFPNPSRSDQDEEIATRQQQSIEEPSRVLEWKTNLILLLGVFLANSDSAIILAFFREIASEFDQLSSASWIINGYQLGLVVAQPVYGKLSDIYGRKPLLMIAYGFYCVGGLLSGAGFAFWGVVLGRCVAGMGNAGITVLVSILIVDMVPMHDVAVWRSYVYAVNQIGRATGPPLGGIISDLTDWRWSLLLQVPLNIVGLLFIWRRTAFPQPNAGEVRRHHEQGDSPSKVKQIDFLGATSLGLANTFLLLFLDRMQSMLEVWIDAFTLAAAGAWVTFAMVFLLVEAYWARQPILPLRLMVKRNVLSSYLIQFFQTAAQMALFTSVPLYFRISQGDSNSIVSVRLLIISLGTTLGGLISGWTIKYTGLYRLVTLVALFLSNASFLVIFLRWRGDTGWWESLYGFPIGLGFGVSLSAAFIGLVAGLDPSETPTATSGFYLSLNLGSMFGVSLASLLNSASVRRGLLKKLENYKHKTEIIREVTANLDKIELLPSSIKEIVTTIFAESLTNVWLFSLVCSCLAFLATFLMREGISQDGKGGEPAHETFDNTPSARGWLRSVWPKLSKSSH